MVACATAFEANFSLHLREREFVELNSMFNDVGDLKRNMKALGIQLNHIGSP
jgi:hypothetical protein